MLSNEYPIIVGVPPGRLSNVARGLCVFFSGRDENQGRQRLAEGDVAMEGIKTAGNDDQGGHVQPSKSRPATRSRDSMTAATQFAGQLAGSHPNTTYDDLETLLPDGKLAVPFCKIEAQDEVAAISTPYIQISDNEGDDVLRESSPVLPSKIKTHGRTARKLTVWSTDDEIEGEPPKDDGRNQIHDDNEGPWEVGTGKRKWRDDADGVTSVHQSKMSRSTWRVTDVNTPVGDDESAPIVGIEMADGPVPSHESYRICEGERQLVMRALTD
jgi:hypothetical protein